MLEWTDSLIPNIAFVWPHKWHLWLTRILRKIEQVVDVISLHPWILNSLASPQWCTNFILTFRLHVVLQCDFDQTFSFAISCVLASIHVWLRSLSMKEARISSVMSSTWIYDIYKQTRRLTNEWINKWINECIWEWENKSMDW